MTEKSDRRTKKPQLPESTAFYERVQEFFYELHDEEQLSIKIKRKRITVPPPYPKWFSYAVVPISYLLGFAVKKLQMGRAKYFTRIIIMKLVRRRILQLLAFGAAITTIYMITGGLWWTSFIPIGLILMDITLILYRQRRGLYGNNDLEFREAVRYVINENRSGRGPGHFEHVFPVLERQMGQEPDALPAGP